MTSSFRLLAAAALCVIALLAGWVSGAPNALGGALSGGGSAAPISRTADSDIAGYVNAILESGLFPDARRVADLDSQTGEAQPGTADALAEALQDPSLSALVKRGEEWRIHLYAGYAGASLRRVGDQLSDGWVIEAIEPTAVVLKREDEARRIEVFSAEPDTQ